MNKIISIIQDDFFILLLILLIINEVLLYIIKRKLKTQFEEYIKGKDIEIEKNSQFYISYYKKRQLIIIYRFAFYFIIFLFFVSIFWSNLIPVISLAVGGFIISLAPLLQNLVAYFILIFSFKIGDTVKLGNGITGEIIGFHLFNTLILGRNETGDHTGYLHFIPNSKIVFEYGISRVDISLEGITKVIMNIYYDKNKYNVDFENFINKLKEFLKNILPVRDINDVGNYKTYIGKRFKMNFEYDEENRIKISIGFITNLAKAPNIKKEIIKFVEKYKK